MRHHRLSLTALVLAGLISLPAPAQQTVTRSYRGVITLVAGEQPDAVQVGETVIVSYTVDPTASDVNPSPQAGRYPTGLLSLTVMLPDSGLAVSSGVGQLYAFDNTDNPDDQIFFFSSNIASPDDLQGLPVIALELDFIGNTNMIASDAVPIHRIDTHDSSVFIATDRGWTQFLFTVTSEPSVPELVGDGISRLQAALLAGTVTNQAGNALIRKLHDLKMAFDASQTTRTCATLTAFIAQLGGMARGHRIDAALAAEMSALAQALKLALGGC